MTYSRCPRPSAPLMASTPYMADLRWKIRYVYSLPSVSSYSSTNSGTQHRVSERYTGSFGLRPKTSASWPNPRGQFGKAAPEQYRTLERKPDRPRFLRRCVTLPSGQSESRPAPRELATRWFRDGMVLCALAKTGTATHTAIKSAHTASTTAYPISSGSNRIAAPKSVSQVLSPECQGCIS
jgi:hypothetical protein